MLDILQTHLTVPIMEETKLEAALRNGIRIRPQMVVVLSTCLFIVFAGRSGAYRTF
jgi:hypothetical protein